MNFINSILLFFAMLLISPVLFNSNENKTFKTLSNSMLVDAKNDPYEGMKVVDGKVTLTEYPGIGLKS